MKNYLHGVAALVCLLIGISSVSKATDDGVDLIGWMSQLQVYLQKLDLSVQSSNAELAAFYLHEIEEVSDTIAKKAGDYNGFPVGKLTESMLMPQIELLEKNTDEAGVLRLVDTCNACHVATDHGFIRISRSRENPFNQEFEPES